MTLTFCFEITVTWNVYKYNSVYSSSRQDINGHIELFAII